MRERAVLLCTLFSLAACGKRQAVQDADLDSDHLQF